MFRIRSADLAGAIEHCVFRTLIVRGGVVVAAGAAAGQRRAGTSTEMVGMRSSALIIFGKLPHDWTRDVESIGGHEKLRSLGGAIGAGHKKLSVSGRARRGRAPVWRGDLSSQRDNREEFSGFSPTLRCDQ
jgi:hypothetical protein